MRTLKFVLGAIATVIVGFLLIGVFIPTVNYETVVEINKPVEETFRIFNSDTNMSKWLTGFKSIEVVEGNKNEIGSRYKLVVVDESKTYEMYETMTAFKENELFAFSLVNDVLQTEVEITFKDNGLGTCQLKAKNKVSGKNMLWRSIFPFFKGYFKDSDAINYNQFKALVEKQ